jgi:Ser/Thr protein kinase RdoA (MazF antagonist)
MSAHPELIPPAIVLEAFGLEPGSLVRATSGLMNPTWFARSREGTALVLQRVNPIFSAEVNVDIAAVTEHLEKKGLLTPRLVPTRAGALWYEHEGIWRVLTRIEGVCHDALERPSQVRAAGRIVAEFHRAVSDLEHRFRNRRLGVHDTARHLRTLRQALGENRAHRHYDAIAPLAERVLEAADALPPLPAAPDRIVHGDPKISNLLFARDTDRALCLIDLDTLAHMPVALELGDALRSWCNPATEDAASARFVRPFFDAAIEGYAEAAQGYLTEPEWQAIPRGALTITVELAARFCTDALRESYFGWNRARYESSSAHNQARVHGQLLLAASIRAQLAELEDRTADAFRPVNGNASQ